MPYDIESQDPISLDLYPANDSSSPSQLLLPNPTPKRTAARFSIYTSPNNIISTTAHHHSQAQLGPVPPVIKSLNGNLFWADESCVRRVGLTCDEARLFLQLQSGNYNYPEYADMFHAFGEEKKNLEKRLKELPWWRVERRKVWEKRVEWLGRLEEPRLWLLYLMARRRRILSVACGKILRRLKEKREEREKAGAGAVGSQRDSQVPTISCQMVSTGSQTSDEYEIMTFRSFPTITRCMQTGDIASSSSEPTSNIVTHPISSRDPSSCPETGTSTNSHPQNSHSDSLTTSNPQNSASDSLTTCNPEPHLSTSKKSPPKPPPPLLPRLPAPLPRHPHLHPQPHLAAAPPQTPYLILGYFPSTTLDPHETYIALPTPSTLFPSLHHAEHNLRGYRRFFSLKSLAGFGLYKCDIEQGAHVKAILSEEDKMVLRRFYAAYKGGIPIPALPGMGYEEWDEDVGRAWMGWVGSNLNGGKEGSGEEAGGPLEGKWSLELVYDWSPYRLSAVVITPLLLSLIVGVWYMETDGDVITSWTLALYIVTAAAAVVALLGIIGSLKDV